MFLNYYIYILFIPMILIGNLLMLISNSWISMWMIMELSLVSMIMLMLFDKLINYELLMKYYLFQSLQSYLYLFSSLLLLINNFSTMSYIFMNIFMLMKLSIIPFHNWYIKIMLNLNWINIYFFSIINKIIPLIIMNNLNMKLSIIYVNYMLMMISSFMSSILGINQTSLKLMMSYSSMIQLSWVIILLNYSEMLMMTYFIIYNYISINMFTMFYMMNINNLNQMNYMKIYNNIMFMFLMMMMLAISGLPPFMGFLMKWISLKMFIDIKLNFIFIMIFIFNSLISMYYYFRLMFLMLMNYYLINKINMKFINFNNNFYKKYIFLNFTLFILLMLYIIF